MTLAANGTINITTTALAAALPTSITKIGAGTANLQVASGTYGSFGLSGGLTIRGGYASGFATRAGTTTVTGTGGPALTASGVTRKQSEPS